MQTRVSAKADDEQETATSHSPTLRSVVWKEAKFIFRISNAEFGPPPSRDVRASRVSFRCSRSRRDLKSNVTFELLGTHPYFAPVIQRPLLAGSGRRGVIVAQERRRRPPSSAEVLPPMECSSEEAGPEHRHQESVRLGHSSTGACPIRTLPAKKLTLRPSAARLTNLPARKFYVRRAATCSALVGRPRRRGICVRSRTAGFSVALSCFASHASTSTGRNRSIRPSLMLGGKSPPLEWRL